MITKALIRTPCATPVTSVTEIEPEPVPRGRRQMIDSEPEIDLAKLAAVSARALVLQGTGMRSRSSMVLGRGCRGSGRWQACGASGTHGVPVELPEINPLLISFPARSVVLL